MKDLLEDIGEILLVIFAPMIVVLIIAWLVGLTGAKGGDTGCGYTPAVGCDHESWEELDR
jgi:hypothetical protein